MRLHLVDTTNSYDKFYEMNCIQGYYDIWDEIDRIINEYKYSCINFPVPEINKEERIIIVHWVELFGTLSTPYIEILECTDKVLQEFDLQIQIYKRSEELKKKQ